MGSVAGEVSFYFTHTGQLTETESKEKVVESKRSVDQRKVKNPLSNRSDPSKSGGMHEEEVDDQKRVGWRSDARQERAWPKE